MPEVRLFGGPAGDRRITVSGAPAAIELPVIPSMNFAALLDGLPPRPPWWRWRARRRWHGPADIEPPSFRQVTYRYLATAGDGTWIYACDPHAVKPGELDQDLYRYLAGHLYSLPPAKRMRSGLHWVMDADWATEIAKLGMGISDPGPEDIEKVNGGYVLGLPITVTDDGGVPHLAH